MRNTHIYLLTLNSPSHKALRLWTGKESPCAPPLLRQAYRQGASTDAEERGRAAREHGEVAAGEGSIRLGVGDKRARDDGKGQEVIETGHHGPHAASSIVNIGQKISVHSFSGSLSLISKSSTVQGSQRKSACLLAHDDTLSLILLLFDVKRSMERSPVSCAKFYDA